VDSFVNKISYTLLSVFYLHSVFGYVFLKIFHAYLTNSDTKIEIEFHDIPEINVKKNTRISLDICNKII
jgi:hypothetical protein